MATAAILDFWNREILLAIQVTRVQTHQHAKFCQNRSIGHKYIFFISQDMAATILDCWIHKIVLAVGVWRAQMHNCTKFRQNRSLRCGDNAIFLIFKMAAAPSWIFEIAKFYRLLGCRGSETHLHAKFCQNQWISCEDIKIFRFFKMAAVRHLGFVWGIFGPPTVSTCGSLLLCKNWIIWTFQYLTRLAGKCLFPPVTSKFATNTVTNRTDGA